MEVGLVVRFIKCVEMEMPRLKLSCVRCADCSNTPSCVPKPSRVKTGMLLHKLIIKEKECSVTTLCPVSGAPPSLPRGPGKESRGSL